MALTPGTRTFAQLRAGALACPACGHVITFASTPNRIRKDPRLKRSAAPLRAVVWDPFCQRIRCRQCGRRWQLGIWIQSLRHGVKRRPAPDVVPTLRELAELRQAAGGLWSTEEYTSSTAPANVVLPEEEDGEP